MKRIKSVLPVLLALALCLSAAAPACAAVPTSPSISSDWNLNRPPFGVATPVPPLPPPMAATPPPAAGPGQTPQQSVPEAPAPQQPAPEPAPEDARLRLSVSPLEGPVGTTLTFSASVSAGKNRRSIALWVFKDGERVAVFPSNQKAAWTYVAESPGVYKGMAIHKGDSGTIYASSKEVSIAAEGGMKWMNLTPPDIWIEPFGNITYVEGTSFEPIPVRVGGSGDIKDASLYIGTTHLLQYTPMKEQGSKLRPEGDIWGYLRSDDFPNKPLIKDAFKWGENGERIPLGDDPEDTGFFGDQLERTISAGINVIGTYRGKKVDASYSFKIRYLRDSDRDGIPDISETERGKLSLTDIADRTVVDRAPLRRFSYRVIDDGNVQWPVRYRSPGMQPYGIELIPRDWTDPSSAYTYGYGVFTGEPRISWLPGEMYRDLLVPYRAMDSKKDSVTNYFRMRVGKEDDVDALSIDPIPSVTVAAGQKMKPIPVTVRTNRIGIPKLTGDAWYISEDWIRIIPLEDHGMRVVKVDDAAVDQQNLYFEHTYWITGTPRLQEPAKWQSGEKKRTIEIDMFAKLGTSYDYAPFTLTLLRPDRQTGDEAEPFQFMPLQDVTVEEGVSCEDIVCQLRAGQKISGVEFSANPLPPGLGVFSDHGGERTAALLRGRPYLEDWQPWETQRKILIYVFAKHQEKGLSSQESFYLTIKRKDLPRPGITPIADQEVVDGLMIPPIYVGSDLPPFVLNSLEAPGLPHNLKLGKGHVISGFINVKDWNEGESVRIYPVTIKGRSALPLRPELEKYGAGNPAQYEVETSFNFKVYKESPWGWSQGEPMLPVKVVYPQSQTVRLGEAIQPISILMDEKDALTEVIVKGLPQGVAHDGSGHISGKPVLGGWSDDTKEVKYFRVDVTVRHPDLKSDIAVNFNIDVLHPKSTQLSILPGGSAPEAPLPPDEAAPPDSSAGSGQQADSGPKAEAEKPDDQEAKKNAEKPEGKSPGAGTEKPEDRAGAGKAEESMTREESILSQNVIRELSPGTPEYEELEKWIAQQEEELSRLEPAAVREGRVKVAIALYGGSQNERDYAQGILLGLQKAGYQLDRQHLSADIRSAQGDEGKAQRLAKTISQGRYDLVVAIGAPMARMLKETLGGKVPLVCGMVDDPVSEGLSGPEGGAVTGIRQRPSLESLLSGALFLAPEAERIGLIHSPFDRRQQEAQEVSAVSGVEIRLASASGIAKLLLQAEQLLEDCDLLIVTEDFENGEMLQQLAAMGLEKGKLVIGGSKAQVTAGLPAACAADAKKISELGGWLGALALSSQNPAGTPWQSPDALDILYDPEGLSALGITPPAAAIPLMGGGGK